MREIDAYLRLLEAIRILGKDLTIKELAEIIRDIVYKETPNRICNIEWDSSKPNGTPQKLMDSSRITALGFSPKIDLARGIELAYNDFVASTNVQ